LKFEFENGFPFSIWRLKVQVMNKRIAKNENGNLTPNYSNTRNKVGNTFGWDMQYGGGKVFQGLQLSMRTFQFEFICEGYEPTTLDS
jgi:hypothetical protein